jgi:arylsulfatase A-like enzyme
MHLPGVAAKEVNSLVQNVDILPTIFDYLKFETKEKIDGKSMLNLIKSGKEIRDKVFLWDGLSEDIKGVRTKDKKLILAKNAICNLCKSEHNKPAEEYDLKKDPEEKKNIFSGSSDLMKFLE